MRTIKNWFKIYFSDPQAIFLVFAISLLIVIFEIFSDILVPLIISVVIAYVLSGITNGLVRWKMPRMLAVMISYFIFIGVIFVFFVWILPLLIQQISNLIAELPKILGQGQHFFANAHNKYPSWVSTQQLKYISGLFNDYLVKVVQFVFSFSLETVGSIITVIVYFVLVPLLTFFFLKDKEIILDWLKKFLPNDHGAISKILTDVNSKIGNYVKGKIQTKKTKITPIKMK